MNEVFHLTLEGLNLIREKKNLGWTLETLIINCMINLMAMHNQRFFSYLSLFTFFMLILVSGANYFVLFVGQPGLMLF
jgi:hypothetical protein